MVRDLAPHHLTREMADACWLRGHECVARVEQHRWHLGHAGLNHRGGADPTRTVGSAPRYVRGNDGVIAVVPLIPFMSFLA